MGRPATLTQEERDELYAHAQQNLKRDGSAVRQGTWTDGFQFSSGKWIEFKVAQQRFSDEHKKRLKQADPANGRPRNGRAVAKKGAAAASSATPHQRQALTAAVASLSPPLVSTHHDQASGVQFASMPSPRSVARSRDLAASSVASIAAAAAASSSYREDYITTTDDGRFRTGNASAAAAAAAAAVAAAPSPRGWTALQFLGVAASVVAVSDPPFEYADPPFEYDHRNVGGGGGGGDRSRGVDGGGGGGGGSGGVYSGGEGGSGGGNSDSSSGGGDCMRSSVGGGGGGDCNYGHDSGEIERTHKKPRLASPSCYG